MAGNVNGTKKIDLGTFQKIKESVKSFAKNPKTKYTLYGAAGLTLAELAAHSAYPIYDSWGLEASLALNAVLARTSVEFLKLKKSEKLPKAFEALKKITQENPVVFLDKTTNFYLLEERAEELDKYLTELQAERTLIGEKLQSVKKNKEKNILKGRAEELGKEIEWAGKIKELIFSRDKFKESFEQAEDEKIKEAIDKLTKTLGIDLFEEAKKILEPLKEKETAPPPEYNNLDQKRDYPRFELIVRKEKITELLEDPSLKPDELKRGRRILDGFEGSQKEELEKIKDRTGKLSEALEKAIGEREALISNLKNDIEWIKQKLPKEEGVTSEIIPVGEAPKPKTEEKPKATKEEPGEKNQTAEELQAELDGLTEDVETDPKKIKAKLNRELDGLFEDKINGTNKTNGGVKAEDLIGKITEIRVLIDEEGKFDREKGLARDNFIKKVNEKDALSPQEKEKYVQDAWKKFNAKRQEFEQNIIERIVTIKTEITKLVEEIEKNMRALQEHNDKKLVLATSDTRLSVRKILNEVKSIVKKLENRELLKDEEYQKVFDNLNATEGETATLSKDAAAKNETKPVLTRISDSMLSPALLEELSVLRAANPTETDILLINRIASKVTLFLENTRKWAEKDPETAARIIDPNYAVSVGDVMEALLNRERQPKKETLRQIKPEEKILIPELSAEERKTAEDHLKQLLGALEWIPRREVKELALPLEVAAEMPRWKQLFGASDDNDVISKWAKIMQTLYQIAEKRTPQGQAPKVMETIGALPGLLDRIKTLSEEVNNATNQIDQLNKTLKERDKELSGIEDLRKQAKRVSHLGDTILRLEEEKTASLQIKEAVSSLANALEKGLPIEPIDTEDFLDENLPKLVNFVTELKNAYESLQKEYADYIKILNTFFAPSLEEIPDLKQIEQDYSNIAMDLQVAYKNNPQIAKRINERNLRPLIKKIVESLGEKSRILQEMLNKLSGKTEASKEDDFGFDLVEDGKPQDKGETSDSGVDLALEVLDKTGKDEK